MKKISLLLLVVLLSLKASADAVEIDGISYNLISNGNTAEVTRLSGEKYSGDIVIPEKIKYEDTEYSVTSIGVEAFFQCGGLTSVTIPNSVTSIGSDAFYHCSGLNSINIPNKLTFIGDYAFAGCSNLISFTIPESVTYIGPGAFNNTGWYNNQSDGILYLDNWLIRWKGEKPSGELRIVAGTKGIVGTAFSGCSDLKIVYIPNSVISICSYAFLGCSGLTKIVSEISNPHVMKDNVFVKDIYNTVRLIVPIGSKPLYQSTAGWNKFKNIVESETPTIKRTIHVATAGTLKDFLSNEEKYQIEELTLTGELNGTDFRLIRDMAGITWEEDHNDRIRDRSTNGVLYFLDLSGTNIINGGSAYYDCGYLNSKLCYTKDNEITNYLFYGTKLETIVIPNSVSNIIPSAFQSCSQLASIIVDRNPIFDSRNNCNAIIETYTNQLIIGCKNTIIPNSVTSIGNSAFQNCGCLTSMDIPNSVTSIGNSAFSGCNGLTSIEFPNSVKFIGAGAFYNCGSLVKISSEIESPYEIETTIFNNDVYENAILFVPIGTKSAYHATAGWNKFKNIVESGRGGEIGQIIVVDGIYYIIGENNTVSVTHGDTSYSGDIVIPNQITYNGICYTVSSIDAFAFFKCSGLTSITIPSSVNQIIGDDAFDGCDNLSSVHISDIESWCSINFGGGSNPLQYANHLFLNGIEIKDLIIPEGVNYIGVRAFVSFNGFTSVTIPNSVTSIGSWAFSGCSGVASIFIGNGMGRIDMRAFAKCPQLTQVYCYAEEVPNTSEDAFDGTPTEKSTLYVPTNAVEAYKSTWPWSDFKEIVPLTNVPTPDTPIADNGIIFTIKDDGTLEVTGLEDGTTMVDILSTVSIDGREYQVTSIGKRAFEGRDNIEYLSIPWSVTSIGEFAFIDCGNNMTVNIADPESWCQMEIANEHSSPLSHAKKVLVYDMETDQIDIPEGVTSIGKYTFYQCQCIKSLNIAATVTSIGSSAFEGCTGLTSLTLSEGMESIGGSAFEGCTGLKNLVIPSTVNTISVNAFRNCKGITDVYCYAENVPNTDENAFDGTPTEKSTLHVPANAVEAYKAAWPWSDFKEIVAINGNDPDGISKVKQDNCESSYYDLYGRRIHQPQQKGLYIRNGKKIVVK